MPRIIWLKPLSKIEADRRYTVSWGHTVTCGYQHLPFSGSLELYQADTFKDALGSLVYIDDIYGGGTKVVSLAGDTLCRFSDNGFRFFCDIFEDVDRPKKLWARLRTKQEIELYIGKYIPPVCASHLHLGEVVTLFFGTSVFEVFSSDEDFIEGFNPINAGWFERFVSVFVKDIYDEQPITGCNISQSLNTLFRSL